MASYFLVLNKSDLNKETLLIASAHCFKTSLDAREYLQKMLFQQQDRSYNYYLFEINSQQALPPYLCNYQLTQDWLRIYIDDLNPESQQMHKLYQYLPIINCDIKYKSFFFKGNEYEVIDNNTRNYTETGKLKAFICRQPHIREILLLEPSKLRTLYVNLKKHIKTVLAKNTTSKLAYYDNIVEYTNQLMNSLFPKKSFNLDKLKQLTNKNDYIILQAEAWCYTIKVTDLRLFMKNKLGACRHRVLAQAYLLDKLIQDKILPAGTIHIYRGGAHAWLIYAMNNEQYGQDLYLIDSLTPRFQGMQFVDKQNKVLVKRYSRETIQDIIRQYVPQLNEKQSLTLSVETLPPTPVLSQEFNITDFLNLDGSNNEVLINNDPNAGESQQFRSQPK